MDHDVAAFADYVFANRSIYVDCAKVMRSIRLCVSRLQDIREGGEGWKGVGEYVSVIAYLLLSMCR